MSDPLDSVLTELEQFGKVNDASTTEYTRRMLNVTRDTGEFLAVLVRAMLARRVLEIGTSNGYSTLWLASAARAIGGSVTTVELAKYKIELTSANFMRSGLASYISVVHNDAGHVLDRLSENAFDLVFLDSERSAYPEWCSAPLLDRRSVALVRSASLLAASPPRWKAKSYLFQSASTIRIHISGD